MRAGIEDQRSAEGYRDTLKIPRKSPRFTALKLYTEESACHMVHTLCSLRHILRKVSATPPCERMG